MDGMGRNLLFVVLVALAALIALDVRNDPTPLQQHLPILIGGVGELKTLRTVAKYADAWNVFLVDPEQAAAKDAVLLGDLYRSTFREGQLGRFAGIKARLDPDRVLRSGLADRLIYED